MVVVREAKIGDKHLWLPVVALLLSGSEPRNERECFRMVSSVLSALFGSVPVGILSALFPDETADGRLAYLYDIEVLETQ